MNAMVAVQRHMTALTALTSGRRLTQRSLAVELKVSLGLANGLLRDLESEGSISVTRPTGQRATAYEITAAGRKELDRLCAAFARESCKLLKPIRTEMQSSLDDLAANGKRAVLLCGKGALADMAASAILNAGMKLAGVVAAEAETERVAGRKVRPLAEARQAKCDVAATLTQSDARTLRKHLDSRVPVIIVGLDPANRRPQRGE